MRLQGVGSKEFQMGVGDMKMKAVFGNACSQLRVCQKKDEMSPDCVQQESANVFYKGPGSKYFRLCRL